MYCPRGSPQTGANRKVTTGECLKESIPADSPSAPGFIKGNLRLS